MFAKLIIRVKNIFTWRLAVGILAGAIIGFLYYKFFGCKGSCPITSNLWKTILLTAIAGGLIAH